MMPVTHESWVARAFFGGLVLTSLIDIRFGSDSFCSIASPTMIRILSKHDVKMVLIAGINQVNACLLTMEIIK